MPFIFQIWQCTMSSVEWNKKEDLLQEQALRHLKNYVVLFSAFTTTFKSELVLLNKVQEFCYDNMNFLKSFNKIILLLYKSELFIKMFIESIFVLYFYYYIVKNIYLLIYIS